MRLLRYLYALSLAVWLGGMVVLGAVAAPLLFQTLEAVAPAEGRAWAGEVFKAMLTGFHTVAYICGGTALLSLVAMALLGPRPRYFGLRVGLVVVMLALACYTGLIVLREMDTIQGAVGTFPLRLPLGDARRLRFDALHQLAIRLMMVNVCGALALLLGDITE